MSNTKTVGLIAGQGRLPFLVADGARSAGLRVVCAGLRHQAEPSLAEHVDEFFWVPLARPGCWIRKLRRFGVSGTIMVGRVAKRKMYTPWRILQYLPDWRALRIWYGRLAKKDKRNDTFLVALADELATGGIVLENSVKYCQDHLAGEGTMTRTKPSRQVAGDIEFGWEIAKHMGHLDIGQSVAVREREVIAVEAIEGTDAMIKRAGALCRVGNWTLIKTAKPNQDMRFDVPAIGPETIENLKANGAACVVVEAGKTLILDMEKTLQLADHHKIAVFGHSP